MRRSHTSYFSRQRYQHFVEEYKTHRIVSGTNFRQSSADSDGTAASSHNGALSQDEGKRSLYLRHYLRWLHPYRWRLGFLFALGVAIAGIQMIEPLFMRFVVDRVLLQPGLDAHKRLTRLNVAGSAISLVIVLNGLLALLRDYRQRALGLRVTLALRRTLFTRMLRLPLARLSAMKTGGILSRVSGDIDITAGLLQSAVLSPALATIRLLGAMTILTLVNWRLAFAALTLVPGVMLMSLVMARRVRPIYRVIRDDIARTDGRVGETFSGIRVVRAFRAETRELFAYMLDRHAILRKELFAQRRELVLYAAWGLLLSMVNVTIVWIGAQLYLRDQASIGDIVACQWYAMLLLNPAWSVVNSFAELQRSLAAMDRVFEVLEMEDDMPDHAGAIDAPETVHEFRIENVDFAYSKGQQVLRDVNVVVPGGTVVALVGRSGAGKTTLTDLITRFHDPTRGRLLLNGIDLRDLRLQSYRSMLAVVQQDTFVFDGSIRDNILFGRPQASEAEVEDAARRANAHDFIVQLTNGYDSLIGERGVKLSGGQRQRLAIARALLAAPQILILDEATSNLDTESEQLIQESMSSLLAGRTTFVIAHRLSTIRRADMILVMDSGRVIEHGPHDTLMAQSGVYSKMVLRQMAWSTDDTPVAGS